MSSAEVMKQLKVKAAALKRLHKEFVYYGKEREKEQSKVDRMKAEGAEEHDLKQAVGIWARAAPLLRIWRSAPAMCLCWRVCAPTCAPSICASPRHVHTTLWPSAGVFMPSVPRTTAKPAGGPSDHWSPCPLPSAAWPAAAACHVQEPVLQGSRR
jgi:hypothetical protein